RTAVERISAASAAAARSRLIHVIPAAGGCGATTIACNVAASLAKKGQTLLIDLDLVRGSVASSFDVRPRYTIADLMQAAERIDRQLIESAIALHGKSCVSIHARPQVPEESLVATPAGLNRPLNVAA